MQTLQLPLWRVKWAQSLEAAVSFSLVRKWVVCCCCFGATTKERCCSFFFLNQSEWGDFAREPQSHVCRWTGEATRGLGQLKGKYHWLRHNQWVINNLADDLQKHTPPSVPLPLCLKQHNPEGRKMLPSSFRLPHFSSMHFSINRSYFKRILCKVKYCKCCCSKAD